MRVAVGRARGRGACACQGWGPRKGKLKQNSGVYRSQLPFSKFGRFDDVKGVARPFALGADVEGPRVAEAALHRVVEVGADEFQAVQIAQAQPYSNGLAGGWWWGGGGGDGEADLPRLGDGVPLTFVKKSRLDWERMNRPPGFNTRCTS